MIRESIVFMTDKCYTKDMINKKSGQSLVECILLVTVVVLVLIIFLRRHGPMENRLHNTLESVDHSIKALNAEIGFEGEKSKPINAP